MILLMLLNNKNLKNLSRIIDINMYRKAMSNKFKSENLAKSYIIILKKQLSLSNETFQNMFEFERKNLFKDIGAKNEFRTIKFYKIKKKCFNLSQVYLMTSLKKKKFEK